MKQTHIRLFMTATESTGGGTTTLFAKLCADNKKTLADQNQGGLEKTLKLRFINAVNTAEGNISSLQYDINNERAKLAGMNLNTVLALKAKVAAENSAITGAKEEYKELFGADMPDQIV